MKHRVSAVALLVLGIAAAVSFWRTGSVPNPMPAPPVVSDLADAALLTVSHPFGTAAALPDGLPKATFLEMIEAFSEPDGSFMYENLLSNERSYQDPIASLVKAVKPRGVYLGVGPEQNFTYIAAIRPALAFIIDIRRQNMLEQLLYKALFEMAEDRAEFVSLLFSRRRPAGLTERVTAEELFRTYAAMPSDRASFESNLLRIKAELDLSSEDETTVERVYRVFFTIGPDLSYSTIDSYAPAGPSYAELMTFADDRGKNWSYLASEESFQFIKRMHRKNLIVPLVGDFAGPKTIRTVAKYLKDHQAIVSAFYLSNVEMYILSSPQWRSFCANVASLPIDSSSVFIRFLVGRYAFSNTPRVFGPRNVSVLSPMIDVLTGVSMGYPPSYYDLIRASK
jgi:hypothetical protein